MLDDSNRLQYLREQINGTTHIRVDIGTIHKYGINTGIMYLLHVRTRTYIYTIHTFDFFSLQFNVKCKFVLCGNKNVSIKKKS